MSTPTIFYIPGTTTTSSGSSGDLTAIKSQQALFDTEVTALQVAQILDDAKFTANDVLDQLQTADIDDAKATNLLQDTALLAEVTRATQEEDAIYAAMQGLRETNDTRFIALQTDLDFEITRAGDMEQSLLSQLTSGSGTSEATANTVMKRDALAGVAVAALTADSIESNGTALNIASSNATQTVNIGSGSSVQSINLGNNGSGATVINLGGAGDTVNIAGTLNNIITTNTQVADKSLVLNSGGGASSSGTSGLYFEEAGDKTSSFIRIGTSRDRLEVKPFATPLMTFNQSLATTDSPTFSTVTANLSGTATTCSTIPNLTGEVTSVGNVTTVTSAAVLDKPLTGYVSTPGTITTADTVLTAIQKLNGNKAINAVLTGYVSNPATITASDTILTAIQKLNGNKAINAAMTGEVTSSGFSNATTVSNAAVMGKLLIGYTGTAGTVSAADTILSFANKTTGNIAALTTALGAPTNANTANQIVKRDASGGFSAEIIAASSMRSTGFTAPTASDQGGFMGWNRTGSSGRACFGNQQGGGSGGWEWIGYDSTGAMLPAGILMSLDNAGTLSVGSGLNVNSGATVSGALTASSGIYLPNPGGSASNLNYYEEYTHSTTVSYSTTSGSSVSVQFSVTRVGRIVTITQTVGVSNNDLPAGIWNIAGALPARFCPSTSYVGCIPIMRNTANAFGSIFIDYTGAMMIYGGPKGTLYAATGVNSFQPFSITYSV